MRIDYFKPLADHKVAWNFIQFRGWGGHRMRMQFTWEGTDSVLAAPLVLDIARLALLAQRRGESGPIGALGLFFKTPEGSSEMNLYKQYDALLRWIAEQHRRRADAGARVPARLQHERLRASPARRRTAHHRRAGVSRRRADAGREPSASRSHVGRAASRDARAARASSTSPSSSRRARDTSSIRVASSAPRSSRRTPKERATPPRLPRALRANRVGSWAATRSHSGRASSRRHAIASVAWRHLVAGVRELHERITPLGVRIAFEPEPGMLVQLARRLGTPARRGVAPRLRPRPRRRPRPLHRVDLRRRRDPPLRHRHPHRPPRRLAQRRARAPPDRRRLARLARHHARAARRAASRGSRRWSCRGTRTRRRRRRGAWRSRGDSRKAGRDSRSSWPQLAESLVVLERVSHTEQIRRTVNPRIRVRAFGRRRLGRKRAPRARQTLRAPRDPLDSAFELKRPRRAEASRGRQLTNSLRLLLLDRPHRHLARISDPVPNRPSRSRSAASSAVSSTSCVNSRRSSQLKMNSTVARIAEMTHHWQIAWMTNSSR